MALAKVYDTEDTIMIPLGVEQTAELPTLLRAIAASLAPIMAEPLRDLAHEIDSARIAAGLDS